MFKPLRRLILALCLAGPLAHAAEPTRIYIANDDHTDFMWTTDADTYAEKFVEMLDWHMKLADETAGNPPEFRNRFNADGSYWLWCYEQKKGSYEFRRLIARIKDGTISAPLNLVGACYGGQPVEAVLRGMYYAGRLERRFDMRFPLATAMENQTLPLGLASLFAGSGAAYSWRGVCGCASKLSNTVLAKRDREMYWYAGHDGQRMLMKWYSLNGPIGGYWEAGSPESAIRRVETNQAFKSRYVDPVSHEPYKVIGLFGFGGDDVARKTGVTPPPVIPGVPGLQRVVSSPFSDHFHEIAKKLTTPARQVIVSNQIDFFKDFESRYARTLDSHSVTYGNEWDLYSASMSETSARAKRAVEKLRAAELLAALVTLKYPDFMNHFTAARDRAFNAIGLFWEHNWTADGPIARGHRAAWEEQQVGEIDSYVNSVQAESVIRLGGIIPRPAKANRFFVLNPLGWPRTDAADHPYKGSANIHVRDVATGKDVPHQLIKAGGVSYLRIFASDVPSAGYKVYEILGGPGSAPGDDAATVSGEGRDTIENAAVKIVLDRDGAIRSFIDKRRGAALAANIGGLKLNDFAAKSDEGEPLVVENRGPVSVTLRARSGAGLEHATAVTLYRDSDRVDIRNEITENFGDVRYWAFSFALDAPAVRTEEVGGINLNKLKSDGGDYADRLARYDHITVNHFVDITAGDGKRGVTLSNADLAFARLGASTVETLDATTPQINMLAGGQVDGSWLGIPDQNGQSRFLQRFALRPHGGYDQAAAMKFALEHQNPLLTGAVISKDASGLYPADAYSLLSVSDPNVLLWALKVAEEGPAMGLIARLWNLADSPAKAEVGFQPGIFAAQRTTHLETFIEPVTLTAAGALPANFARQQLQTYRIIPRSTSEQKMPNG